MEYELDSTTQTIVKRSFTQSEGGVVEHTELLSRDLLSLEPEPVKVITGVQSYVEYNAACANRSSLKGW